jgi:Winged helix DNA-binding domain
VTGAERRKLGRLRLHSQLVSPTSPLVREPVDVVRWMTAMQAQDFPGAKWAVGLRLPGSTDSDIEQALANGSVVRSWPLRGTLHFTAAEDLNWMLSLTRDRMVKRAATTLAVEDLTAAVLERAGDAARAALTGGGVITRDRLYELLADCGVSPLGQARYHALWYLCQLGTLCLGPPSGKTQTFVLLDEWVRHPRMLDRDEALSELAFRYFRSHGPATERDFSWWSSLTLTDARAGLAGVRDHLERMRVDDTDYYYSPDLPASPVPAETRLLPGFDEYLLGYTDRTVALADEHSPLVFPGRNGMFLPTIVVDGAVAGVWKRTATARQVTFSFEPFEKLTRRTTLAVKSAAEEYAAFVGLDPRVPA